MSLELAIQELTAAVKAQTEFLAGATVTQTSAATAKPKAETKAKPAPEKKAKPASKYTREEMQAMLVRVNNEIGKPEAKAIIAEAGFDAMKDISEEMLETIVAACEAALTPEEDGL